MRVDDKYRLGEVNGGWTVLRAALNAEHGLVERDAEGLQKLAAMAEFGVETAEAMDKVAAIAAEDDGHGRRLLDDESVAYRLGRGVARMEAALSTPEMFGRVAVVQTMREVTPVLMDILGAASSLPADTSGSPDNGATEYLFRLALPAGIYGGSLEVFRNMIAEHALGLGRPNYGQR